MDRKRSALAALVGVLMAVGGALPAVAGDNDRHGRGKWERHGHDRVQWHRPGWHDHGRWDRRDRWDRDRHHHHHHGRRHRGNEALAFGLGALTGLAAGSVLAQPRYAPPPVIYHSPGPQYAPPPAAYGAPVIIEQDGYDGHCREYQRTVTVGGRLEQAYGTACLQPDGTWRIMD